LVYLPSKEGCQMPALQGILGTCRGSEVITVLSHKKDPELNDVYFGAELLTSFRKDDQSQKKVLIAMLSNAGVKNVSIADAFEVNPCLVTRYAKINREKGLNWLLKDERGRPGKTTPEIELFVRSDYRRLRKKAKRNIYPKIMERVYEKFGVNISKELIRQITLSVREKASESPEENEHEMKLLPHLPAPNLPAVIENGANGKELAVRMQEGFHSRYVGGLLLNGFISKLTEDVAGDYKDAKVSYDMRDFMHLVIQMVQFDIVNIERVKRISRDEFGILAGASTSPSLTTMRRKLNDAVKQLDVHEISTKLAGNYLANLSSGTDIFYMDDHLKTYSGKEKVLKGFSHIYDRMMEGMQHSFLHDSFGNPICFELRDNYNNFNEFLPVMVRRLRRLYTGGRKPTFVFDRFGYSRHVFAQFDNDLDAYYIVWTKGDKTDYSKSSLEFDKTTYLMKRNEPGKPRRVSMEIAEAPAEGKQRRIVIRRKATRRIKEKKKYMYSSLVTNDMKRPKEAVVEALIYRWREECDFKVCVNEFGLDQITSYLMDEYREDIFEGDELLTPELRELKQMQNPMLNPLRYRKNKIKREIAKIDEKVGKWVFTQTKKKDRSIAEAENLKRNKTALQERRKLEMQLKEIEEKIRVLPKKVNRLEVMMYGKCKTFDFGKKVIMDTLKICGRNVRKMALETFDNHYQNYRDQLDFMRRIIRNGGYVKLNGTGEVIVKITPFDTKAENKVLAGFLDEINGMKPRLLGDNPLPLKFKIGRG